VEGLGQPFGVLQQNPARRQAILFTRLGGQSIEFREMMAQQVFFFAAGGGQLCRFLFTLLRRAPIAPGFGERRRVTGEFGESIKDHAMIGGVE
jgi:hypothetical protein